ncbi:MAG: hypothetical protein Q8N18_02220 [Opitutaceae bacterium]|nr:hypothetical protein [Opitutaceae bacterium]
MPKFSDRYGYTTVERAFQRERIDDSLRTALWNVLSMAMWERWDHYAHGYTEDSEQINALTKRLWFHYFRKDMDYLPEFRTRNSGKRGAYDVFKEHFFSAKWFEVYNFLEFLLQEAPMFLNERAISILNQVFETENAAYRIVGEEVVEITDKNEIRAIEEAIEHPDAPVRAHIQSALAMLSDRENPDYRNSIKESISAVEATCRIVTGLKSATLGDALKKMSNLHPALQKSFLALYGYTSDASGIRHSLLEESNLTYADAKFMLAACSTFVSYLRSSATSS